MCFVAPRLRSPRPRRARSIEQVLAQIGEAVIDHFKRFNDTFGHDAGDFVLSSVAREMTKQIRLSDMACRYGGGGTAAIPLAPQIVQAMERAATLRHARPGPKLTPPGPSLPPPP